MNQESACLNNIYNTVYFHLAQDFDNFIWVVLLNICVLEYIYFVNGEEYNIIRYFKIVLFS